MGNKKLLRTRIIPRRLRMLQIWGVPLFYTTGAVVLSLLAEQIDAVVFPGLVLNISVQAGTAILSSISSGILALTGIVFSLVFVLVQFGSSAYSPRLVSWFVQDGYVRHSLGVFLATFISAIIGLAGLDRGGVGQTPAFAMLLPLFFVFASMVMFIGLTQRTTILQMSNVLQTIGRRGREVIADLYPDAELDQVSPIYENDAIQGRHISQTFYYSGGPAAIVEINFARLLKYACKANALIELEYAVGDTVVDNAPLVRVYGGNPEIPVYALRNSVVLGVERTIEQDPKYAIRLLVDIAIKALSAAVNDPTTAVQALNQIEDLLRRLGKKRLDIGRLADPNGELRVIVPTPDWDDFLALSLDEIRYSGSHSIQVMRRMVALLDDLEEVIPPHRRLAVEHYLAHLRLTINQSFDDLDDRFTAAQVDRQGIGLSREPYDGEPEGDDEDTPSAEAVGE